MDRTDLRSVSTDDLNALIAELASREEALGAAHSLVQGELELLRAERIARFRRTPPHVDPRRVAEAVLRRWLPTTR